MEVRFEAAVPQFTVPDVVRTAEYYRDVLGFEIAGYWDGERAGFETDPPPVFGIVQRDRIQVFFNRADAASIRTDRGSDGYDVYLRVSGWMRWWRSCALAAPTSWTDRKTGSTDSASWWFETATG
jgi:hypothetical protein